MVLGHCIVNMKLHISCWLTLLSCLQSQKSP